MTMNDGVDHLQFQRFRCKNVKMDKNQKTEMSAVPVTAGDGTTHAEPRRAARRMGSATPSLVGVHHAARCFRSRLACGAPPVAQEARIKQIKT